MAEISNAVLKLALQMSKSTGDITPEAILQGYAILMTMDESRVRIIVEDKDMGDIEASHKWFSDKKLDCALIKKGISLLIPAIIPDEEREKQVRELRLYIENAGENVDTAKVLEKAFELASIPMNEAFADANSMDNVKEVNAKMREALSEYRHKKAENAEEDDKRVASAGKENSEGDQKTATTKPSSTKVSSDVTSSSTDKDATLDTESPKQNLYELSDKYKELTLALMKEVKGQDPAITQFVQGYNQGELFKNAEKGNHPRSYFFFFGPPGVGKTFMAETAAAALGLPFERFDMSSFVEGSGAAIHKLLGRPVSFQGAGEGILTKFVKENPECIIVFDEIEKAGIEIIRSFLQILGSGVARDEYTEKEVSFRDAIIIFTSNVGKSVYKDRSVNLSNIPQKVLLNAIREERDNNGNLVFPPEFVSRIEAGNTIVFNHMPVRFLAEMVESNFRKFSDSMEQEYGVRASFAEELPLLFLFNRGSEIDARVAQAVSDRFLKNEMYELMRQLANREETDGEMKSISFEIDWDSANKEVKNLFENSDKQQILYFGDVNTKLFEGLNHDLYEVLTTNNFDEAVTLLANDLCAIYIDPLYGLKSTKERSLSATDYDADGVRFFQKVVAEKVQASVFIVDIDRSLTEIDKSSFIGEGANKIVSYSAKYHDSFLREFEQIQKDLYMEKQNKEFTRRGWVLNFNTRQTAPDKNGLVKVAYYDFAKQRAVDTGASSAVVSEEDRPTEKFDDVIGAGKAKEELAFYIDYLKNPRRFLAEGGQPPKGVLLWGKPGTGKTMLARALAGESDVMFLQVAAAEFMDKYVGGTEEKIRELFATARQYAPSIVFIDEIDVIGRKRTGSEFSRPNEDALTQLFKEMDGFKQNSIDKPVFVVAATNYDIGGAQAGKGVATLDDALVRRFNVSIQVELPNEEERRLFLTRMAEKKKMTDVTESGINSIAERTPGKSIAILAQVVDDAVKAAIKEHRAANDDDLLSALENREYGEKKSKYTEEYHRSVAIHETGHAYVSYLSGDKPSYITVESRGDFGGYMRHANQENKPSLTKDEIIGRIRTALAGRAAETVFYDEADAINTGASGDLENATFWAFELVLSLGMGGSLVVLDKDKVLASPMATQYVQQVDTLLKEQMEITIQMIRDGKDKVKKIADILYKENRLTGDKFEKLMEE